MDERRESALTPEEAAFAERVARPLRRIDPLPATFDEHVLQAIGAGHVTATPGRTERRHASWWREPRTLRISPLAGLAMAAGFAGVVAAGTMAFAASRSAESARSVARAAPDTVHVVRFVFRDSGATRVALVGDFNGWAADATPLVPTGVDGVWSVSVPLSPGRHEYAFVTGGNWSPDPTLPSTVDDFGIESSVLFVGTGCGTNGDGAGCSS